MEENKKVIKINNDNKDINNLKDLISPQRLESPSSDNEFNTILFRYNNTVTNNNINDNKIVNKEEKTKTNYSHDKEIMEDSIIYFTKKLKQNNIEYQKFLYFSISIYFIDIIIWYFNMDILHTLLNLCSLLIILLISIFQAYIFKHNFESISKDIYITTQRIIYIYSIALIIFLLNLSYITFYKIIYNSGFINNFYQKRMVNFFGFSLVIFFYIIINFVVPIIVLVKLITIKRSIKSLSAAKGEIYEPARIKDVQIINSIIN